MFDEEDDAWVRGVSIPLLCWYEAKVEIPVADVVIYAPREEGCR